MRKILPIVVLGIFILSSFGAGALSNIDNNAVFENEQKVINERATHTVLGEYGTATWCGYCRYAHGALKELYAEGQLDFYYITHVADKNSKSYSYLVTHYNLYGYPTLWWDGGLDVDVGAGSIPTAKTTYTTSINYCGSQSVEDVDIDLSLSFIGDTEMKVDCTVNNNEASTYGGTIQVAICEKVSSRGWTDTGGQLYTMPFLDWAFNEPLSISSGGSWSDSMTWDGASHGYPTVSEENTIVIAAVYNDEKHSGYSYPPNSNPFDAYYVDECVAAEPGGSGTNEPPNTPDIDGPTKGVPDIEYEFTISASDPNNDDVTFYVQWGDDQVEEWIGPYSSGENVLISHTWAEKGLYFIKVKAKDTEGEESNWKTLTLNIPRPRTSNNVLLNILTERFPNLYTLLLTLLGL